MSGNDVVEAHEFQRPRPVTRLQRIARAARWGCDGIALLLGIAAFVNLVGGEGDQGWFLFMLAAAAFALGQVIRVIVKGSVGRPARREKAKWRK